MYCPTGTDRELGNGTESDGLGNANEYFNPFDEMFDNDDDFFDNDDDNMTLSFNAPPGGRRSGFKGRRFGKGGYFSELERLFRKAWQEIKDIRSGKLKPSWSRNKPVPRFRSENFEKAADKIKSVGAARKGFTKIPKGFKEVKDFGYQHGQKVYEYKGKYYSRDIDSHNGGAWKVFEDSGGRLKRIGTADENLNIFKN
jgi:hypothetical protein